jgi:ABC-2 type transport system permease protein
MRESGGSIYDLGYQGYSGPRLGRRHAAWAVYVHSLRLVFGISRPWSSKIAPWLLMGAAYLPAIVQVGVASLSDSQEIELTKPEEYYKYIQIVLAIFVAVVAPELAGRDQRFRTLSLYFSRAIAREDYALAKYAALVTAMLALTLGPQVLMFIGNGFALDDLAGYAEDQWAELPAAAASALLIGALFAGIGLAISAQTSRRAYSTIAIVAVMVVSSIVAISLVENMDGIAGRYGLLISPLQVADGLTFWFFGATDQPEEPVALAGLWGGAYALTAIAVSLACVFIMLRRYRTIEA